VLVIQDNFFLGELLPMRVSISSFLGFVLLVQILIFGSGCQTSRSDRDFTPNLVRVFIEENAQMPSSHLVETVLPMSRTRITIRNRPVLLENDIVQAGQMDSDYGPALVLVLTPEATRDLMRASSSNLGRRMVMTVNGVPLGSRYIDRIFEEGTLSFYVEIDDDDMPELVENIQKTSQYIQSRKR